MISSVSSPFLTNAIQSAASYVRLWRSGEPGQGAGLEEGVSSPQARNDGTSPATGNARADKLDESDQRRVEEMKSTDRAVRAHEAAHMAAGGHLVTSGASYTYESGPDGQRYAVAGEVGIDTSKGRTPEETLARAEQIRSAALAPADPSGQDRAVAAAAAQMAADARAEIARANVEKHSDNAEASGTASGAASNPAQKSGEDRALSFERAIQHSLSPNGQSVNFYA